MAKLQLMKNGANDAVFVWSFVRKRFLNVTKSAALSLSNKKNCRVCRMCEVYCPEFAIIVDEVEES